MAYEDSERDLHATGVATVEAYFQQLALGAAELAELKTQGFVSCERRSAQSLVYKLRFRMDGRQRTRYLGADVARATQVSQYLAQLQALRRANDRLRAVNRLAATQLRAGKQQLEPLVRQAGLRFHGRIIRRPRPAKKEAAGPGCIPAAGLAPDGSSPLATG